MGADASHFVDKTVTLRNDHGRYLSYNGRSYTGSPNQAEWEQWKIEEAGRDGGRVTHVYLHNAAHNIRLSASDNKRDLTGSPNRAGWEKWSLEAAGDRWYLKSAHGTYLNQGSDGNTLQSKNRGGSELFAIHVLGAPSIPHSPSGKYYLTNVGHSKQLTFSDNHTVALSPNKAGWEQVRLETHGGKLVVCGAHGRQLQVDGERVSTSPNKSGWEQFTLEPTSHAGQYYLVAHTGRTVSSNGSTISASNGNRDCAHAHAQLKKHPRLSIVRARHMHDAIIG